MSITGQSLVTVFKKRPVMVAAGVLSLVFIAALYWRSDLIGVQQQELDQKMALGRRYQANVANAAQLPEQLAALSEANRQVESRAIRANQLALNLQYFYQFEAALGLKYMDIRPGGGGVASKVKGVYVPLNFSVSVQGPYEQMLTFLRSLEQGRHFCRINTMALQTVTTGGAAGAPDEVKLSLNLDLLGVP